MAAVDSSSFQPSRIGVGSIDGAPRPAGRISNSMCADPARLLGEPPEDRAGDHPRALLQRHRPEVVGLEAERRVRVDASPASASWTSPPALRAAGRVGLREEPLLDRLAAATRDASHGGPDGVAGAAGRP